MKVGEALAAAARRLTATSDTPRLDAELLMAHALGVAREEMLLHGQEREAPEAGAVFVQSDLATTLRKLVEAERVIREAMRLPGTATYTISALGYVLARAGRRAAICMLLLFVGVHNAGTLVENPSDGCR